MQTTLSKRIAWIKKVSTYPKMSKDINIKSSLNLFVRAVEQHFSWNNASIVYQDWNLVNKFY